MLHSLPVPQLLDDGTMSALSDASDAVTIGPPMQMIKPTVAAGTTPVRPAGAAWHCGLLSALHRGWLLASRTPQRCTPVIAPPPLSLQDQLRVIIPDPNNGGLLPVAGTILPSNPPVVVNYYVLIWWHDCATPPADKPGCFVRNKVVPASSLGPFRTTTIYNLPLGRTYVATVTPGNEHGNGPQSEHSILLPLKKGAASPVAAAEAAAGNTTEALAHQSRKMAADHGDSRGWLGLRKLLSNFALPYHALARKVHNRHALV